jgi:nitric oxide reductase large subunit
VESTHGVVEVVVAILLVALSLWLGYFVVVAVGVAAALFGIQLLIDRVEQEKPHRLPGPERDKAELRYVYLAAGPLLVVVLLVGFGSGFAFGYMAGGVFWGIYAAALTACVIAASWVLSVR